jgi:hypothetical protein
MGSELDMAESHAGASAAAADAVVDCVTQASMDSFPASDPPGWIFVRVGVRPSAPEVAGTIDTPSAPEADGHD